MTLRQKVFLSLSAFATLFFVAGIYSGNVYPHVISATLTLYALYVWLFEDE